MGRGAVVAASNVSVYTRNVLVGGCPPPNPCKDWGTVAPALLSRLRRLLLPAGREKSSPCPLLAVTILLFLGHAQNPLHVVFGREQFHHLRPCPFLVGVQPLVFRQQRGILPLQRLDGWQLFQAQTVKVPFRRLTEDNISGKLSDERFIKLSRDYEQEQAQLKTIVETLGREVKQQEQKKTNVRKFISAVKKYTDMTQLDATPTLA